MDISITVDSENPVADGLELQKFLSERDINGVDEIEMARTPHEAGQQGLGKFLGDLLVKVVSAGNVVSETAKALTELIKAIGDFTEKFRKKVKLGDIEIPAGKLTAEQIQQLVLEYMKTKNATA